MRTVGRTTRFDTRERGGSESIEGRNAVLYHPNKADLRVPTIDPFGAGGLRGRLYEHPPGQNQSTKSIFPSFTSLDKMVTDTDLWDFGDDNKQCILKEPRTEAFASAMAKRSSPRTAVRSAGRSRTAPMRIVRPTTATKLHAKAR